jgi:hypothetical protein
MKNASQIINFLQHKPQFSKLVESQCIAKLKSALLPSIQYNIKYGYIKNKTLYFVLTTSLNKLDIDNIINTIKMILNSPMILQSQKFLECSEHDIEDIKIYSDNKPHQKVTLYTTSAHKLHYKERAKGEIKVEIEDEKLASIAQDIVEMIKERQ